MQRRTFLQHAAAVSAASALAPALATARLQPSVAADTNWQAAFANALKERPWLAGYRTVSADAFDGAARLTGALPAALQGTLYRNGPARHEIGTFRYQHWFDGDGLLQAWDLGANGVRHKARMIETPKLLAERKAGRALYPGFGTYPPNPEPVTSPDQLNVANISVLLHHERLYALWEAGSAVEMAADSLETVGMRAFSEETDGVPFSAHPRIEPDGTLWNFGYVSGASTLVLWHLDATGQVKNTGLLPVSPMSMPHDFMVTRKHLVIMIPPLHYQPPAEGSRNFLDSHQWHPERATRVLVIDKNDFSRVDTYELPAQWVFHYGNAWEDDAGIIRFDGARAPSPAVMTQTFRGIMRGAFEPAPPSRHYAYRIDPQRKRITESPLFGARSEIDCEFPVIDPRVSGRQNQQLVLMTASAENPAPHGLLNAVSRYRYDTDRLDTWTYPISQLPEEHLFVPTPGSAPESDGWIVGTAYDYSQNQTLLNVFAAQQLQDGPVCTATLPYGLPLGLHGKFTASV